MTHNKFCINMSDYYTEFKLIIRTMCTTTQKRKKQRLWKDQFLGYKMLPLTKGNSSNKWALICRACICVKRVFLFLFIAGFYLRLFTLLAIRSVNNSVMRYFLFLTSPCSLNWIRVNIYWCWIYMYGTASEVQYKGRKLKNQIRLSI